jgi:hypothetical protein
MKLPLYMPRLIGCGLLALWLAAGCQSEAAQEADTSAPTPIPTETPMETEPAPTEAPLPEPTAAPVPTAAATEDARPQANADVLFVRAAQAADGTWRFDVTVFHPDAGWEDYADGWDVLTPDGAVLKLNPDDPFTRLLLHPHENEQPFTRSQSGLVIPEGITKLTVRAHDLVDGFGGREVVVDLTRDSGSDFSVEQG